jgi:phospholipid/cholesterol/gamma-HCH transport system substrate-binding protein
VFGELTRDTRAFESLIVDTARLSGLLAERRADLSGLVGNANAALGAIGSERRALATAIARLPAFMRQANTTFVNLRAALSDLNPLVEASKPVADRLSPFFSEFRAAASDAVPTIRDLSQIVRRPGSSNDLVELTRAQVPLARAGVGSGAPDCGSDPLADFEAAADDDRSNGALGETTCALQNQLPQVSHIRAYIPEWVGWFDGFSTSGTLDASGGIGRISLTLNAFSPGLTGGINPGVPLPDIANVSTQINARARCPGALERDPGDGSTPFTDGGAINCDPDLVPPGD